MTSLATYYSHVSDMFINILCLNSSSIINWIVYIFIHNNKNDMSIITFTGVWLFLHDGISTSALVKDSRISPISRALRQISALVFAST